MASPPNNRSSRPMSGSRSFQASQSFYPNALSASSSRPFLNMLNPMARQYQGYTQANQSLLLEEEEEDNHNSSDEERDMEAGAGIPLSKSTSHGKRRVSWDAGASKTHSFHPNIHQQDKIHDQDSSDDEVPQSFMIEATSRSSKDKGKARDTGSVSFGVTGRERSSGKKAAPVLPTHTPVSIPPRPSDIESDNEMTPRTAGTKGSSPPTDDSYRQPRQMRGLDAYERALWNWVNVYNLDAFLQEVYYYYEGKGIYSIALAKGLNLLTVGFVIGFSTFLLGCIDYSQIQPDRRLSDVIVDRCVSRFSGLTLLFFILFTAFYVWEIVSYVLGVRRLVDMYNFYTHLLKIPDEDVSTISWPEVVRRIGAIREENPITAISSKSARNTNDTTTATLDAHDVANRIMRQENYLIALFNKELLDLRIPVPRLLHRFAPPEAGKGRTLTQALEWNLRFCLMEYLFDQHGRVRKVFLKSKNRAALIEGLERRFIFMGILNAIFAPFIVLYLLMYSFFRYFEQYHKDPSTIGGRRYTSFAQWKFREFNELPHFFARRLNESVPYASMYIGQFPNEKMFLIMRFVAFVSGSFAAVLFLATVLDPDIFVHLEITPHRTVLFYLGVFGSVMAVARGMIPEENRVFDPELLMTEVVTHTHYLPDEWKGQLHSKKVHQEFGELFQMKVLIFVEELLSVVLTPFVLWFSLPRCAPALIDFFREFSVHVDGRGYVCSFAEFNFERHGNVKFGAPAPARTVDKRMISNDGKMEKSFLNFKAANPDWKPADPSGSLYLSRMADFTAMHPQLASSRWKAGNAGLDSTVHLAPPERKTDSLADRAQEYDRALKQSQTAARKRGTGGSFMANSTMGPGPSSSSIFGGMSMAQTAVLGDSQGSVLPALPTRIPDEDIAGDGGVGSELGESYVDGGKRSRPQETEESEEPFVDDGVLGLLAQIYERRDGHTRVI